MTIDIRRREFIAVLGGGVAWPFTARAQPGKLPTIGLLGGATASAQAKWTAAFVERLRELGWTEGQTVAIEYRWLGDAPSAHPRSSPSSSGARSMSLSRMRLQMSWPPSKGHR